MIHEQNHFEKGWDDATSKYHLFHERGKEQIADSTPGVIQEGTSDGPV
jgi:hypothetical protein